MPHLSEVSKLWDQMFNNQLHNAVSNFPGFNIRNLDNRRKGCFQRIIIVNENLFLRWFFWQFKRAIYHPQSEQSFTEKDLLTWNLTKNSIVCVWYSSHSITTKFCACHDSTDVVTSTAFCCVVIWWINFEQLPINAWDVPTQDEFTELTNQDVLTETLPKCILRMIYKHGFKYINYNCGSCQKRRITMTRWLWLLKRLVYNMLL